MKIPERGALHPLCCNDGRCIHGVSPLVVAPGRCDGAAERRAAGAGIASDHAALGSASCSGAEPVVWAGDVTSRPINMSAMRLDAPS